MEITDIYVAASKSGGSSVGYGTVTFGDILKVRFNIMKTKDNGRLFINWPSQKGADGTYYPQVSFVQDEEVEDKWAAKNAIEEPIVKEFNKLLGTNSVKDDKPKDDTQTPAPKKRAGLNFAPSKKG